jgi:CHAP domain.
VSIQPSNQKQKTNMKKLKTLVLALLTMAAVINTTQAADATTSPNGFKSPECTFAADLLTSSYGWNLKFSRSYGRDAYLWPSLITNGKVTTNPQANDLMVLDAWSGGPVGHVAWVWGRSGGWICVIHTNMRIGTDLFTYGGATFRYAWFWDYGNGSVYCWDNGKTYPLKAFITKK